MKTTAALYIRVSTDDQAATGTSLATQEEACRDWCRRHEFTVAPDAVFSDAGESAKTADRPQFIALLAWCAKHRPAVVVVWKYDRWARNATDHAIACAALERHGTRLVSATEPTADDPAGRLLQTILAGVAQFDNEVRAQRSRLSMASIVARGGWVSAPLFGFVPDRAGGIPVLREDPEQAAIVRDLFAGLADGNRTLHQTINIAREAGIPPNTSRALLRKSVYCGQIASRMIPGKTVQTAFPGIVSQHVWNAAQIAMGFRAQVKPCLLREEFPLRGLLLCIECRKRVTASYTRGNGGRYGYYQCMAGHVRGRAEDVHESWKRLLVASKDAYLPLLDQIRYAVGEVISERLDAARDLERNSAGDIQRLRRKRQRLMTAYVAGAVAEEDFKRLDAEIADQIAKSVAADQTTVQWSLSLDEAVLQAVSLLQDPVRLWDRLGVEDRQRVATAFFGIDIVLDANSEVRTFATDGMAKVFAGKSADSPVWHPSSDDIGTFLKAMKNVSGLMAAA